MSTIGNRAVIGDVESSGDWPTDGYDTNNTGANPNATGPKQNVSARWVLEVDEDDHYGDVVVADGVVFSSGERGVRAIDNRTGEVLWNSTEFQAGDLAVAGDTVYVTGERNYDAVVVALDATDGSERWSDSLGSIEMQTPRVANGVVLVDYEGRIRAYDATSGTYLWSSSDEGEAAVGGIAIAGDTVYLPVDVDSSGPLSGLLALNLSDGSERWRFEVDGEIRMTPTVTNDTVYLGKGDEDSLAEPDPRLYALDTTDGSLKWVYDSHAQPHGVAVADGRVFAATGNTIRALDETTGTEQWRFNAGGNDYYGAYAHQPVFADGVVYAANDRGTIYGLDPASGAEQWQYDLGGRPEAPVVAGDSLYVRVTHPNNNGWRGSRIHALEESPFTFSGLSASTTTVAPGDPLTVDVSIENTDDVTRSYNVTLVDDRPHVGGERSIMNANGTLAPSTSTTLSFTTALNVTGDHNLSIRRELDPTSAVGSLTISVQHPTADREWPMVDGDSSRSNVDLAGVGAKQHLQAAWNITMNDDHGYVPVVANGTTYIIHKYYSDERSDVVAFDEVTGEERWRYNTSTDKRTIAGSAAATDDMVFLTTFPGPGSTEGSNATMYGIHASNGTVAWTKTLQIDLGFVNAGDNAPVVADDRVYIAGSLEEDESNENTPYDGRFYALDAATGNIAWSYTYGSADEDERAHAFAIGPDYVFLQIDDEDIDDQNAVTTTHELHAIDRTTHTLAWRAFDVGQNTPVLAGDGYVYTANNSGYRGEERLYAFDITDGSEAWRLDRPTGNYYGSDIDNLALVDDVLYVDQSYLSSSYRNDILYKVNATTGTIHWNRSIADANAMAVVDGLLYAGGFDFHDTHVYDASTGEYLGDTDRGAMRTVANGTLYTYEDTTGPNRLWALRSGAQIVLSNTQVSSNPGIVGTNTTISATATNVGTLSREFRTNLALQGNNNHHYVYGGSIGGTTDTLAPGESTTVSYVVNLRERGEYTASIEADYHWNYGGSPTQHTLDQYVIDNAGSVTLSVGDAHDGRTIDLPHRTMSITSDSWPKGGLNTNNTGHHESTTGPTTVAPDVVAWNNTDVPYGWTTAPTLANGTVYVGGTTSSHYLQAINTTDGTIKWGYRSADSVIGPTTYADGFVYFGDDDNRLYAVNTTTGKMLWSFHAGEVQGAPIVDDGVVYFGTDHWETPGVYALNASTRDVIWSYTPPDRIKSSVSLSNGTVYASTYSGDILALNATTGTETWQTTIASGHSTTAPVVVSDSLFVGNSNEIAALNATDGSVRWSLPADLSGEESDFSTTPAVANGTVFFGDDATGQFRAVDATTGTEQWHYTLCSPIDGSPAVVDDVVYFGANDGYVYALNVTTGADVWNFQAINGDPSYPVVFAPAVVDGVMYVATDGPSYPSLLALTGGTSNATADPFSLSGLTAPANTTVGQAITVSATVANAGESDCGYTASLAVDGSTVDTTTVTVPDGSTTVSFTYTFASEGTYDVTIDDLPATQVTVTGPEPRIEASPSSYDYGDVVVGDTHGTVNFLIENTGNAPLEVSVRDITGADSGDFGFSYSGPNSPIPPGGSSWVGVWFAPSHAGTHSATIELTNNATAGPFEIPLTGNGIAGTPDVNVTPSFVDFGDVPVNGSTTKSVTVTNDGDETLTVSGASASPGEYSVTAGGSGDSLAPGASTTVDVTFAPTSMGTAPGSLSIASDDPDTPTAIVELTGNATAEPAPAIAVNRTSYYFEGIPVDGTSQATFELSNTGTAPLEISGTTFSGVDAGAFTVTTATPVVVQPGSNTTLTVEFTPTSLGSHIATLNVSHNDTAASPTSIELGGTSIDTTPPTVSITDVNGTAVNGTTVYANDTVVVNGTATDQHGSVQAVTVDLVSTFTTFTHTTNATYDAGTGNWSATVVLAQVVDDGVYHVVVAAEDDSGNTNTATATEVVDVDRRPPEISTVMNRVDESTARVNVTADDRIEDGSLAVTVDRPDDSTVPVTLTESNGKWTGTFALAGDGQYNATASARDAAGNQGVANATILFENRSTDANNTITVKVVPSNLFVRFTTNQPVEDTFITMTSSRTPLAPLVRGNAGVNFIDAVLGKKLTANLSYATIGIPVDESLLPPNTSPDDVTIRYFNETTRQWEDVATTREHVTLEDGTSGEYWVANVSHFSTYGAIVTDTTAPTITDTSPTTGHEYAAGTTKTTLGVDYADSLSGVNASAVTLTFDGSDVTTDSATSITSKRATYQATGLTNGSSHTLVVSIEDHAGNTATETITFDVATPSSSTPSNPGSGGSGGSGSGTPPTTTTPPANTDDDPVATPDPVVDIQALAYGIFDATVSNARANARNTFTFPGGDLDADGVTLAALDFTATADGDYAFQVSTSTDLPRGTAALDGETATALAYVNVSHPNVSNALIANATFHLTVSQERLDDAGVAASDLTVYRFSNGTWTPLETSVVETTADAVVLEANSPGLSVFAVGARQAQTEVTTTEQPPQTTTPATTAAPADTSTPKTSNENVGGDDADDDDVPDIGASTASIVLIGLLALLAALAVVLHRRRS